jgi:glycosyltransferase involved in cell wall biosynthesis
MTLIDDASTDDTVDVARSLIEDDDRFSLIINNVRCHALKNVVSVSRKHQDDPNTIIAIIDGDDELCNDDAVKLIIDAYEKGGDVVWTSHKWDVNGLNISKSMPSNVDPYQWPWCSSHLKTFRATLLKKISDKNFQDHRCEWFKRGYDQCLFLPLLYQTKNRVHIPEICYLYKINSVSMPTRDWNENIQLQTINFIRARGFLHEDPI